MKKSILISIPNYGDKQLNYLNIIIDEFLSYQKYDVTINVHSTCPLPRKDINLILYDPSKISRMTYLHRQEFINNKNNYDLFLYTENDVLIKEDAIDMYIKYCELLPINHCLGFIRYEKYDGDDNLYTLDLWPNVNHLPIKFNTENKITESSYITSKKVFINGNWYFMLTNCHQSCYIITKKQLNIVINMPGYLKTDIPNNETSSCGIFTTWNQSDGILYKVHTRNLDDLKKCLIHHLPDNHVSKYNLSKSAFATWNSLILDLKS